MIVCYINKPTILTHYIELWLIDNKKLFLNRIMMSSSNWNIFCVTVPLWGNSLVTGEFPSQRPATRSFVFLICAWTNYWVNNRGAGNFRRHRAHYDVDVMINIHPFHRESKCRKMLLTLWDGYVSVLILVLSWVLHFFCGARLLNAKYFSTVFQLL